MNSTDIKTIGNQASFDFFPGHLNIVGGGKLTERRSIGFIKGPEVARQITELDECGQQGVGQRCDIGHAKQGQSDGVQLGAVFGRNLQDTRGERLEVAQGVDLKSALGIGFHRSFNNATGHQGVTAFLLGAIGAQNGHSAGRVGQIELRGTVAWLYRVDDEVVLVAVERRRQLARTLQRDHLAIKNLGIGKLRGVQHRHQGRIGSADGDGIAQAVGAVTAHFHLRVGQGQTHRRRTAQRITVRAQRRQQVIDKRTRAPATAGAQQQAQGQPANTLHRNNFQK